MLDPRPPSLTTRFVREKQERILKGLVGKRKEKEKGEN
jgi:hypothetical protein